MQFSISNPQRLLDDPALSMQYIRAMGSGGQKVNKVSTAVHLRFDIAQSNLPDAVKALLLDVSDTRLTTEGILIIKAQQFRTQEANRNDALERLMQWINKHAVVAKTRRATKPSKSAKRKRTDDKKKRGDVKKLRQKMKY
ncbi:alternative ribosome rescue aminoacyl-tRNA hydrolase ArfB [Thalassotalea agarivorans]|uniref:Ribosome-associated protein n=1 Tax=Thalassotalea agarivorans TaxID=349064 RepID=A0A1H9YLN7_THASX|nr:alternative ribosome rescue aminoacyl-tRNA hydrolase ArfB [Thalassotalea agarivorans]SES69966.1 ribosome-associated protein [Thalassotalea agarivorans]